MGMQGLIVAAQHSADIDIDLFGDGTALNPGADYIDVQEARGQREEFSNRIMPVIPDDATAAEAEAIKARARKYRPNFTGIVIDENFGGSGFDVATVSGHLFGDNVNLPPSPFTLRINEVYPKRFKRIYRSGTTARGIKLLGV